MVRFYGSSSHLGNVKLIALTGSLFHAQTNGLSHIIEELLPKSEDEPLFNYQKHLAIRNIAKKWTMPIHNWKPALNRFAVEFAERFPR